MVTRDFPVWRLGFSKAFGRFGYIFAIFLGLLDVSSLASFGCWCIFDRLASGESVCK